MIETLSVGVSCATHLASELWEQRSLRVLAAVIGSTSVGLLAAGVGSELLLRVAGLLAVVAGSLLIHEWGHAVAYQRLTGDPSWTMVIDRSAISIRTPIPMTGTARAVVAGAGPVVGALLALGASVGGLGSAGWPCFLVQLLYLTPMCSDGRQVVIGLAEARRARHVPRPSAVVSRRRARRSSRHSGV